ncbi:MAG TPA: hypothetical protein VIF37_06645 [Methylobacter sp.]
MDSDSTLAVLPIPVVAFFMAHTDLNEIKVDIDHGTCAPAVLTRILTLGIWQWCSTYVSWKAGDES